ncbi:protocadherin beta-11 isoform X2 [Planococcus citri]|uniref:protocadherin beta-11 isoform X2 n=1 Tax=Planococcus citri TaxID=170843 RepID=UPI0031F9E084
MLGVKTILLEIIVLLFPYVQPQDNRCYLENGGSAESFFVSEDLSVGSFLGSLKIIGDAGEFGNIELHLKETDSPVSIAPFTKNLSLVKQLDKEGIEGPASVFINVICDRKRTLDPSFIIPVNIRVTDVNDNAPQFINAPYLLNVSEVTVVGTRVLQGIRAVDADQQGPFSTVQYSVLPGLYSEYFSFVNGLEGTLVLRKPLDYESLPNFTITIRAQDQGNPPQYSDAIVYVNVIDADDQNPKFADDRYVATLPDHATQGTRLRISPREISAYDQDLGIKSPIYYSFNSEGSDYRYFDINRDTGSIFVKRNIPDDDFIQPAVLVVRATQFDNADRYALATLTISRPGTSLHDLQFLHNHYFAAILENVPVNSVLLTVITNKPRDKRLKYWLSSYTDTFNVTPNGDIILKRPVDYETVDNYGFLVYATDGYVNTSASVNISVLNVNDWDPRFRYPQYEFFIPDVAPNQLTPGTVIGKVEAADGDRGDHVTLSLRGPYSRLFSIDDSGEISVSDLSKVNSSTVHLVAVATDSGIPPRQASVPVIVHLPEAVVSSASQWVPQNTSFAILVSFISILGVLALIIVLLILYIQKHKKPKNVNGNKLDSFFTTSPPKRLPPFGKVENPVFNGTTDFRNTTTSTSPLYTATVKRTSSRNGLARNGVQRTSPPVPQRHHKIAPAPPQVPNLSRTPTPQQTSVSSRTPTPSPQSNKCGNDLWSIGSIPRRVKKLSWDDEADCFQKGTMKLNPDVSVTPLVNECKSSEHMNLTVYF